jgi:hypothetical protein
MRHLYGRGFSCFPSVELNVTYIVSSSTRTDMDEYIVAATGELYQGSLDTEFVA